MFIEDMKPERIQFAGFNGVVYMNVEIGSFEDAVQIMNLTAWGLSDKPGWEVESAYFEGNTFKVRIVRTAADPLPNGEPETKS